MLEHLVQSHMGGYYISDGDPEFIEEYCETCGDYDMILTSWNSEEENARLNALLRYFIHHDLDTKKDLDQKVNDYDYCCICKSDIIPSIIDDIRYNNEEVQNIMTSLFEDHSISEYEYDRITHISNIEEKRQLKMVKKFADSYFSRDSDGEVKVLKLKPPTKRY